jgi:polysaccharide transporter, PST family
MRKYLMLAAQVFNLVLPFITLPVLSNRLGPDVFGEYAVWISTATFVTVLSDWGFNVYGVSEASRRSKDYPDAFRFLLEVSSFKLTIGILVTVVLWLVLLWSSGPQIAGHFLAASSVILGGVAFPLWFYNGIDKVGYALAAIVPLRVLQFLVLLAVVATPQDLNLALLLAGMPQILSVGLLLFIASRKAVCLRAVAVSCRLQSTIHHVAISTQLFISSVLTASFANLSSVVLNLFVPKEVVGHFYLADRALRALLSLYAAFSSGVLAERAEFFREQRRGHFAVSALLLSLVASALVLLGFFTIGGVVLEPILGASTDAVLKILDTYIFIIPIVFVSNVLGIQILLPERHYSVFANNITVGVIIYWSLVFPVGYFGQFYGYMALLLITELVIGVLMYRSCRRYALI